MTCAAIMTAEPQTVRDSDPVGDAVIQLVSRRYLNLPVVDRDGRLVGLFGVYDLLALLVPRVAMVGDLIPNLRFLGDEPDDLRDKYRALKDTPVGRAMNREPVVVYPDTSLVEAVRLFCRAHTTLPVVERDTRKLLGVVSHWDAIQFLTGDRR